MVAVRNLIPVLGDQLTPTLTSLAAGDPKQDVVLMAELHDEATYVRHHKKKIAFLFSAMRHFAEELRAAGWTVDYVTLDAAENGGGFTEQLRQAVKTHRPQRIVVTEPGEWRVGQMMAGWEEQLSLPVDILPDTRFLCTPDEFAAWARGRKQLRMEYFYREMRRKTGLLMEGDTPEGGRWNYDTENRKPAALDLFMPKPKTCKPDAITKEVLALVEARFGNHFGDLEPFWFAVTRADAQAAFTAFVDHALPFFGDYQDAMLTGEPFLYHAVISQYLNCGLLDPLTVCRAVEAAYHSGKVPLNAAEGFIRQIIGWREYVRGIYWLKMPGYVSLNALDHHRPLPDFYWTAETDMACVKAAVTQTKQQAYAHHIQRLMVTGNFALLAGIDPHALHEWYLSVYADAYEWVELPNTLGMSQFADGGLLASKPYAASGAYINRMSNYCGSCRYDVKQRTGAKACPFNALYWDFIARHRDRLAKNPRMAQMLRSYDNFDAAERERIADSAAGFLASLD
ncbi:cryptochrome/photolyase family protein [Allorhizobium taibaishanense]|uniref:Deoxyribodipyrimidine photolyase n=1 Tax=Allorhizobium taibaishanense TaxID=887144 RepID=A0A1Q9A8J9_9HYPH|nr:cryptochrome/photolyase family protein [Allorhizobium taibaishanense]MBB4009582.1 deoxyribodipyrimidine photolyase-related protein [Allorhizobium taibaishanense]OLP50891.1 deoxyribodipyrimidine photolyase [Allorhizobium taibaishanense]